MTRTITVTGGFSGAVSTDVTDSLKQLLTATFNLCLVPVGNDDPPPVGTATGPSSHSPKSAPCSVLSWRAARPPPTSAPATSPCAR